MGALEIAKGLLGRGSFRAVDLDRIANSLQCALGSEDQTGSFAKILVAQEIADLIQRARRRIAVRYRAGERRHRRQGRR